MKKSILILSFLFVAILSFAQTKISSYKNQIGVWNVYSKTYDWEEPVYSNIDMLLDKNYIKVFDKARSLYTIIKYYPKETGYTKDVPVSKYESYGWDAIDEENRKMYIMMVKYVNENQMIINMMYDDRIFRYYLKKNTNTGLDKF
jgi:hypothetical protein